MSEQQNTPWTHEQCQQNISEIREACKKNDKLKDYLPYFEIDIQRRVEKKKEIRNLPRVRLDYKKFQEETKELIVFAQQEIEKSPYTLKKQRFLFGLDKIIKIGKHELNINDIQIKKNERSDHFEEIQQFGYHPNTILFEIKIQSLQENNSESNKTLTKFTRQNFGRTLLKRVVNDDAFQIFVVPCDLIKLEEGHSFTVRYQNKVYIWKFNYRNVQKENDSITYLILGQVLNQDQDNTPNMDNDATLEYDLSKKKIQMLNKDGEYQDLNDDYYNGLSNRLKNLIVEAKDRPESQRSSYFYKSPKFPNSENLDNKFDMFKLHRGQEVTLQKNLVSIFFKDINFTMELNEVNS